LPEPPLENFPNYIDGLAVTGFMFNIGATNPALEPIITGLSSITGYGDSTPFSTFDLNALISPAIGGRYATYEGGLTTPTCNEVVRWINMEDPLEISSDQLAAFRTLLDKNGNSIVNNFRSPQDLGGRTVRVINP
jgi:carbonic anhydrase